MDNLNKINDNIFRNSIKIIHRIQNNLKYIRLNNDFVKNYVSGGFAFYLYSLLYNIPLSKKLLPNDIDITFYLNIYNGFTGLSPINYIFTILGELKNEIDIDILDIYIIMSIDLYDNFYNFILNYFEINYYNYDEKDKILTIKFKPGVVNDVIIKLKLKFTELVQNNNIYQTIILTFQKNYNNISLPIELIIKNNDFIKNFKNTIYETKKYNNLDINLLKPSLLFYNLFHLHYKYNLENENIQIQRKKNKNLVKRDYERGLILFRNIINHNNNIQNIMLCYNFLLENLIIFKIPLEFLENINFINYILYKFDLIKHFNVNNNYNALNNMINKYKIENTSRNVLGNISGNLPKNLPNNTSGNISSNLSKNLPNNTSGNISGNLSKNLPNNTSGNISSNLSKNLPNNTSGNISSNLSKNLPNNISGNLLKNLPNNTSGNISGNLLKNLPNNTSGNISGNLPKNLSINTPENNNNNNNKNIKNNNPSKKKKRKPKKKSSKKK